MWTVMKLHDRGATARRCAVEGSKFCFRWWSEIVMRRGRRNKAIQTGRGIMIVSTKQVVGIGEERVECGPWI